MSSPTSNPTSADVPPAECEAPVPWSEHKNVLDALEAQKMRLLETKLLVQHCKRGLQRLLGYNIPPTATGTAPNLPRVD